MTLADLQWGLMMMVVGMGAVFALLALLMLVLMGVARLDRGPAGASAQATADSEDPSPAVHIVADGLDADQVAAITIAVMTHAENRRRLAAPETRAHAPGSQLFASRWLAVGRGRESSPFRQERK